MTGADPFREVNDAIAKGSANLPSKGTKAEGKTEVEPNRNFPLPGTSYDTYKKTGHLEFWDPVAGKARPPEDIVVRARKKTATKENRARAVASEQMLAENRMLVHLIERFQPERLVSVHQHHLGSKRGDSPGVFVDPRRPPDKRSADDAFDSNDKALTSEGQQDDKLAFAMLAAVQTGAEREGLRTKNADPLGGNTVPLPGKTAGAQASTVHYASTAHSEGNSLGDYAPVEVKEGGPGDRPAIATYTIEIPRYDDIKDTTSAPKLDKIEVDTLMSIFLEDPSKPTP